SIDELNRELDNVSLMLEELSLSERAVLDVHHELSALKDVLGTLKTGESSRLGEIDFFELTAFCLRFKSLLPRFSELKCSGSLAGVAFNDPSAALKILDPADTGRLSFFVESSRSAELLEARNEKKELEKRLHEEPEKREEILSARLIASKKEEKALDKIYAEMTEAIRPLLASIRQNAESAGRLDLIICKARLAKKYGCVRPKIGGGSLRLMAAVHPEIADALSERKRDFTPIDIELPTGISVLTGANMGGKSVAIKTVALNIALALSGNFVFCEKAEIPCFSRIELINKDFSNAIGGLSSFGGEIIRFNEAAGRLKEGGLSFIAMDEFARGTNAEEGAAIAKAVVAYLADKNAVSILATHYDGTARYAARHYQVKGLSKNVENSGSALDGLRSIENAMDYGLIEVEPGLACPRDALSICRILGMDESILRQAEKVLTDD
ncbi:MAG: hypothetical protein IK069_00250, partial [Firmicutes bacterium]|nr:hypothetical protein [Bacillota bacterium]